MQGVFLRLLNPAISDQLVWRKSSFWDAECQDIKLRK